MFTILCIFWGDYFGNVIYCCVSASLFGIYLVYETQLLLGKGNRNVYGFDHAYLATIQIYLDIIKLICRIPRLLQHLITN